MAALALAESAEARLALAEAELPAAAAVVAHGKALGAGVLSEAFPALADGADELGSFRSSFLFPAADACGRRSVYLCGNSLGLQPAKTRQAVLADLDRWAALGVEGHFEDEAGKPMPGVPWWTIEDLAEGEAARIVGAEAGEVVIMNSLTVNLHLLLAAFYRPSGTRDVVVIEDQAFPSDEYAVQSVVSHHGLDPEACIVRVPHGADFVAAVEAVGERCAVVLVGALQYRDGAGLFNFTSTRVSSKQRPREKHPRFEFVPRDDRSSKDEPKRVENDRDRRFYKLEHVSPFSCPGTTAASGTTRGASRPRPTPSALYAASTAPTRRGTCPCGSTTTASTLHAGARTST